MMKGTHQGLQESRLGYDHWKNQTTQARKLTKL